MNQKELPEGYEVKELTPGVWHVTGPDGFRQTWSSKGECVDAAVDHHRDGFIVSPQDD